MGSLCPAISVTAVCCMTLVVAASLSSILQLFSETEMSGDAEFDKLELRNRTVTETLSPVEDLGQDKKENAEENGKETNKENGDDKVNGEDEKYDKLELRNRTVTETLSLVKDLGQDKKEEEETEEEGGEKFDKLELRNRTVTETMSLVSDFGKNEKEEEEEEPVTKKQKFDTLSLRNRDVTETLSPLEN